MKNFNLTPLGGGAGLRAEHFQTILNEHPPFKWFEILIDNFIDCGGYATESLDRIRNLYTVVPHGVCLSIGSTDALDQRYLKKVSNLLDHINAPWMSDHLCFTMVDHVNLNELIPLPFTDECVRNVVSRVKQVQDSFERPFLLENVTRYLTLSDREMSESEFIGRILEEADCGLLLDLTNVYLNSIYHEFDPLEFVMSLPLERVGQIHVAGWEKDGDTLIDSHDAPVPEEVWDLLKETLVYTGPTSVLVEWDRALPSIKRLLQETQMADALIDPLLPIEKVA